MNIKSLLLGSAAALVAVSGARAADVIVPMEEPVDYVRVCDVYGEGFHYIPGTETCMKLGGYVRFRYIVGGLDGIDGGFQDFDADGINDIDIDAFGAASNAEGDDYAAYSRVRARLTFDIREETELGTLRAVARVQAQNRAPASDAQYGMDQGFIQLGGLTLGYLDSLWTEGDGLLTESDLAVGDFQVNRASYTFAASGLSATVSLEDDGTGDFAPDVVGRIAYEGGFGGFYLAGSYDEEYEVYTTPFGDIFDNTAFFDGADPFDVIGDNNRGDDGAFALKGAVSLTDLIAQDSEFKVEATYAFDPSVYNSIDVFGNDADDFGVGVVLPVEYSIGAGYAQSFGKLGLGVSGIYGETFNLVGPFDSNADGTFDSFDDSQGEFYKFVADVGYEITSNFDVLGEVYYTNVDLGNSNAANRRFGTDEADITGGFVQFVRSF